MSANEFTNIDEVKKRATKEEAKRKKKRVRKKTGSSRVFVQIMNGEFLSKDNFVKNLPFTFFLGFLLVVLIGWGYYAETITKKEVQLERELGELNSEFFTLGSEYNSMRGRRSIAQKLEGTGVEEALTSPRKIRVKRFVFKDEK